jgi:hypothetical protein
MRLFVAVVYFGSAPRWPVSSRPASRPIDPRDAGVLQAYVRRLSPDSRYHRFFGALYELPPAELDRVIHLDRKYELALLAETLVDSAPIVIGEARYGLRPIGSKANSHFRSQTTGAARGSAFLRCSLIKPVKMVEGSVCIGLRAFAGVLQSFFPFKCSSLKPISNRDADELSRAVAVCIYWSPVNFWPIVMCSFRERITTLAVRHGPIKSLVVLRSSRPTAFH